LSKACHQQSHQPCHQLLSSNHRFSINFPASTGHFPQDLTILA
jgi:hypothetical protein